MLKKLWWSALLLLSIQTMSLAQERVELDAFAKTLADAVKRNDKSAVAEMVKFPFKKPAWVTGEKADLSREEFLKRYDEIFTKEIKDGISYRRLTDVSGTKFLMIGEGMRDGEKVVRLDKVGEKFKVVDIFVLKVIIRESP
jgi:hypothetical protein